MDQPFTDWDMRTCQKPRLSVKVIQGTFAPRLDWSRNGKMLVFDALVQDATTGNIKGIANVRLCAFKRTTLSLMPSVQNRSVL